MRRTQSLACTVRLVAAAVAGGSAQHTAQLRCCMGAGAALQRSHSCLSGGNLWCPTVTLSPRHDSHLTGCSTHGVVGVAHLASLSATICKVVSRWAKPQLRCPSYSTCVTYWSLACAGPRSVACARSPYQLRWCGWGATLPVVRLCPMVVTPGPASHEAQP
jgi:hypothetical protein